MRPLISSIKCDGRDSGDKYIRDDLRHGYRRRDDEKATRLVVDKEDEGQEPCSASRNRMRIAGVEFDRVSRQQAGCLAVCCRACWVVATVRARGVQLGRSNNNNNNDSVRNNSASAISTIAKGVNE
jgi:hypothetical protein